MDTKRGDDAQDHAPQPKQHEGVASGDKQEAANYEQRTDDDGDGAIEVDNMSSANDEGAN